MVPSQYMPRPLRPCHILYVRRGRLMTKNIGFLQLLESLSEVRQNAKELGISYLVSKMVQDSRARFIVLVIKTTYFYIKYHTKCTAFHVLSFYGFGELFLQKLYKLWNEFSESLKPSFLGFMGEKLARLRDERKLIKQLYLNIM